MDNRRIGSAAELSLHALADLFGEGFREYLLPMRVTAPALAERIAADQIDLAASRVLFAEGKPAALALIARRGSVSRLAAMGVAPSLRGQGAGKELVEAVLSDARSRGDLRMRLEVLELNTPARALYERRGFRRVRRLVGYEGAFEERPLAPQLRELDPAAFSRLPFVDEGLPWQLERASLAAPPAGARCFSLDDRAFAYVSGAQGQVAWVRGLFVDPAERRRGWGKRIVQALAAVFPAHRISVPPLVPEGLAAPFFAALGFSPAAFSQLELAIDLAAPNG
jgi:GNAT superfamily N-acetyltransferase